MRICTLGDLLLDVIVRLEEPLSPGADAVARTRSGAGGQAANVTAWVAELGADARFIGKRGSDAAGALVALELEKRGVELLGPVVAGATGTVVSIVGPDGERTMASDRGVAPELEPGELDAAWLADCDWLHIPGYSLLRSPIAEAAAEAARLGTAKVSVDLSSWTEMRDFRADRFRERVAALEPEVVFANEQELHVLGDDLPGRVRVAKRGARGFSVDGREFAANDTAVDATGAGDALAAGFLVGGPELALEAATRCVSKLGAMP
ncbi:MAG: carbohydrate kinase family protein [Thermoleophilia bacterium]